MKGIKSKLKLFLSIFLLVVVFSNVYSHENKIIHPFVLSGKAWTLLKSKTEKMKTVSGLTFHI